MARSIDSQQSRPLGWKNVVKRVVVVLVAGVAIYLVLPSITEVLAAWPRLSTLDPLWFAAAVVAEVAHFTCTFGLQRLALRTRGWFAVITAQLSGNAITNILPAGDAAGAAVQYRMLSTAGIDPDTAVGGLTAFSLLGIGGLLALPIFALPAIVFGAPVSSGLTHTAFIGIGGFFVFAGFSAVILVTDKPLAWGGRVAQRVYNAVARHRRPIAGLDRRLLRQRDVIRSVLGQKWREAVLLSAGRLAFDFFCLLAAPESHGKPPAALTGALGLRRGRPGRAGADHARWPGHRRGKSGRHAGAGRRQRRRRLPGHPHLPARLLLAPDVGRTGCLRALPAALRDPHSGPALAAAA